MLFPLPPWEIQSSRYHKQTLVIQLCMEGTITSTIILVWRYCRYFYGHLRFQYCWGVTENTLDWVKESRDTLVRDTLTYPGYFQVKYFTHVPYVSIGAAYVRMLIYLLF